MSTYIVVLIVLDGSVGQTAVSKCFVGCETRARANRSQVKTQPVHIVNDKIDPDTS